MKVKIFISIGLVSLLSLIAVPVYANGIPDLPHAFYGTLTVNGSTTGSGYQVEARGTGVITTDVPRNPITTTVAGEYGSDGLYLLVQGDIPPLATITFYVEGRLATSDPATVLWRSGETSEVNLSVTIARAPGAGGGGGAPDTTPPRISEIAASNITETSADISWKTHELSDSQIEYWSSPSHFSPLDEEMVIYHLVYLTDLTPGTTYYYKTMSCDRADNLCCSDVCTFTTLGEAPAAIFTRSDLSISPSEVNIGETVTISTMVANTGNASGSYEVTLKINGVVEATKDITIKAGASKEVTFTTSRDVAGSYSVDVNGLSGSFTVLAVVAPAPPPPAPPTPPVTPPIEPPTPPEVVKPPVNWPVVGGIIGGVVVVGLLIFFVVRRRRA